MPAKPKDEPTLSLSAEERRANVERVRRVNDGELKRLHDSLSHAAAVLPGLLAELSRARSVIEEATRAPEGD